MHLAVPEQAWETEHSLAAGIHLPQTLPNISRGISTTAFLTDNPAILAEWQIPSGFGQATLVGTAIVMITVQKIKAGLHTK